MKEIEIKAKIEEDLSNKIIENNGVFLREVFQEDIYFNHPCRDFKESDEALRLRKEGNNFILTFKGRREEGKIKKREEIEAKVEESIIEILERLGFKKVCIIRKKRKEFSLGNVKIFIDDVENLGKFIEIEGNEEKIFNIMKMLGIKEYIKETYLELIMK
jgi:adenylate cyclase class 2